MNSLNVGWQQSDRQQLLITVDFDIPVAGQDYFESVGVFGEVLFDESAPGFIVEDFWCADQEGYEKQPDDITYRRMVAKLINAFCRREKLL